MFKKLIVAFAAVLLVCSASADDCEVTTPLEIECMGGRKEGIYYSYNGGRCRRMYGCFSAYSTNLYEEEDDCIKDLENC